MTKFPDGQYDKTSAQILMADGKLRDIWIRYREGNGSPLYYFRIAQNPRRFVLKSIDTPGWRHKLAEMCGGMIVDHEGKEITDD